MKKSYHSIVVPIVAAITALRNCALCSASVTPPDTAALAIFRVSSESLLFWQQVVAAAKSSHSERLTMGIRNCPVGRPAPQRYRHDPETTSIWIVPGGAPTRDPITPVPSR